MRGIWKKAAGKPHKASLELTEGQGLLSDKTGLFEKDPVAIKRHRIEKTGDLVMGVPQTVAAIWMLTFLSHSIAQTGAKTRATLM